MALAAALLGAASNARGQSAAPPPGLVAPVLQQFIQAEYPAQASKDGVQGTVTLQLDIDAEGHVTNVTVLDPAGHGFDEAATDAAKKFVFEPALKNGKKIPSRITYRYSFTLKEKPPEPGEPPKEIVKRTLLKGVVDISGTSEHLEAARVTITGQKGEKFEVTTDASGAWSMSDLPTGKYHVKVSSPGYTPLEVDEDVALNEATEVTYRLTPANASNDVVVRGERPPREVTKRTLDQRELSRIPGTNGDALRAIQNLPGVARPPGFAGLLIVRGSAPNDTQVFIDGSYVPLVYHFGGLSSVVPTEMLEKIDFYPGNFSAQYGRVQGGIVDVAIRKPNTDGKYHGLAQADFIDARVLAEGPIPIGDGWSFIAGARRSYVDVWLKPVLKSAGAGVTTAPVYYDYQAFIHKQIDSHSSLRVGFFGSDDSLALFIKDTSTDQPGIGGDISFHTAFYRGQIVYQNDFTENIRFRIMGSVGKDAVAFNLGSLYFNIDSFPVYNRTELSAKLTKGVTLNVGTDLLYQPYNISLRLPPPPAPGEPDAGPFITRTPISQAQKSSIYRPAMYGEVELVPAARARIVAGFRADYAKDTDRWDASPRLSARYDLHHEYPRTTLKGGAGIFYQPPQPQETSVVFGSPHIKSNRAIHYSVGVEQEINRPVDISVEGFYKQLDQQVSRTPAADGTFQYGNLGTGYVVGAEVLLRYKPDKRFFGWVAYTLSRSIRRDQPDEAEHLFQYDQTHILTLLGSYQIGGGWEFGARYRLISGNLETPCAGGIFSSAAGAYSCLSGAAFSQRLPPFSQLDLRIDKRWVFETWRFSMYLDVQNVTNRQNPDQIQYNFNYTQSSTSSQLPIIPSLGVRGEL